MTAEIIGSGKAYNILQGGDNDRLEDRNVGNSIYGGEGDDFITVVTGGSTIEGGGNDKIYCHIGDSIGDDLMVVGAGDTVQGGEGNDTYLMIGGTPAKMSDISGFDTIEINATSFTLAAGFKSLKFLTNANVVGKGNDAVNNITSFNGDDKLYTYGGNDLVYSGAGRDLVDGGSGEDWVDGQEGNDTLDGGDGRDTLVGGTGNDIMTGGGAPSRRWRNAPLPLLVLLGEDSQNPTA